MPRRRISWFVYVVRLGSELAQFHRDWILKEMIARGIGSGRYFAPIHMQPTYESESGYRTILPVTEWNAARTLALPFFNRIQRWQIEEVCQTLNVLIDRATELKSGGARASNNLEQNRPRS
jgi:perosamine synthetase